MAYIFYTNFLCITLFSSVYRFRQNETGARFVTVGNRHPDRTVSALATAYITSKIVVIINIKNYSLETRLVINIVTIHPYIIFKILFIWKTRKEVTKLVCSLNVSVILSTHPDPAMARLRIFPQTGYPKFINMAKDCWLCEDSISHPFDSESSALP